MKFLCDRCKTRYSIGDDRVRGKILKIRCKNCSNVITVREGMSDVDASDPQGLRKRGTTQAVPMLSPAQAGLPAAMPAAGRPAEAAKPPPALEDEWYVSIDGNQDGPYSLAEARRWVGGKPFDAELHCWKEGFDDWLPVDKVSHFRGLRKKPSAPPPVPRTAMPPPRPATAAPARPAPTPAHTEPEPKPLFAATMASLERSAAAASSSTPAPPAFGLPGPHTNGSSAPAPLQARGNGTGPAPRLPLAKPLAPASAPTGATTKGPGVTAAATTPAPAPQLPAFDLADSATQVESAPFPDRPSSGKDVFAKALDPIKPAPVVPDDDEADEDDEDLQIGEVSRVVNLADLRPSQKVKKDAAAAAPNAATARTGSAPRLGNTAALPRLGQTAAVPRMGLTGSVPRLDPNGLIPPPSSEASMIVRAEVAKSHRVGLMMLIGAAVAVLAGVIVAVVMFVGGSDDELGGLSRGNDIDTTRPDDPLRRTGSGSAVADGSAGSAAPQVTKKPSTWVPRPKNPGTPEESPPAGGDRLQGDEIETMARTQGAGTQRCYMRAQRGAEAILIGDVKKVLATLTIAPDGTVTSVGLDKHADNSFGKCLIGAIKGWRFRASPGGNYRLTLQFVST